jgi:general secretion pathway protein J
MKPIARSDVVRHPAPSPARHPALNPAQRPARHAARRREGFTLIELLVAIAILAVIAVLSWRGLDQITRSRDAITRSMEEQRAVAQFFDQLRTDARHAATDDQTGGPALSIADGTLRVVRNLLVPGAAPRLQAICYQLVDGRVVRYASPPLANVGELRRAVSAGCPANDASAVSLMGGVASMRARLYVPQIGWTTKMQDVLDTMQRDSNALRTPGLNAAPLLRSTTGLEVTVQGPSQPAPLTRVLLVGE